MRYNSEAPYELMESDAIPRDNLDRLKNFARFWELLINRRLFDMRDAPVFDRFLALSDSLFERFGRNWGIPKHELLQAAARG
jgi:hypothetical protein